MPEQIMDLTRMMPGEKGVVVDVLGGQGFIKRLETLGIRIDVEVVKVSAHFARGTVVLQVGNTQSALGFGMAMKVLVLLKTKIEKE